MEQRLDLVHSCYSYHEVCSKQNLSNSSLGKERAIPRIPSESKHAAKYGRGDFIIPAIGAMSDRANSQSSKICKNSRLLCPQAILMSSGRRPILAHPSKNLSSSDIILPGGFANASGGPVWHPLQPNSAVTV